jgi:hypothetical protein
VTHLEGKQSVLAALDARRRRIQMVLVKHDTPAAKIQDVLDAAEANGVPVKRVDGRELDAMAHGASPGGVLALVAMATLGALGLALHLSDTVNVAGFLAGTEPAQAIDAWRKQGVWPLALVYLIVDAVLFVPLYAGLTIAVAHRVATLDGVDAARRAIACFATLATVAAVMCVCARRAVGRRHSHARMDAVCLGIVGPILGATVRPACHCSHAAERSASVCTAIGSNASTIVANSSCSQGCSTALVLCRTPLTRTCPS